MAVEQTTAKIVRRLEREGWVVRHGGNHDVFTHPGRPGHRVVVTRHRKQSIGVAKGIAEIAGWT